ncbi:MAG: (Na+)-NQR maturation NqrM [Gammaproteobacteria bacterium]|nr:(Na+)-NQR maturation NqrM [Gammaproteobacteria bacterium]
MTVFLLSLVLMLAALAAMSIGLLLGRSGIRGSCGALSGVDGGSTCGLCRRPCARRRTSAAQRDRKQRAARAE